MKSKIVAALGIVALIAVVPIRVSSAQTGPSLARGWEHTVVGPPENCERGAARIFQGGAGLVLFDGCDTQMLTSADGVSWHQVSLPLLQLDNVYSWNFVAAGQLFLLYGPKFTNEPGPASTSMWASPDGGKTWKSGTSDLQLTSVAASGDGLIAAARGPNSFNASLWKSANGLTWKPLPDPAGVFSGADVRLIVHTDSRWLVGGAVGGPTTPQTPAIWSSTDGHTWTAETITGLAQQASIASIVGGPKGMLAILNVLNSSAALVSSDGQHWQPAKNIPVGNFYYYFGATSVAAWQGGFIWLADEGGEAALWSSTDGMTWTRVGGDELFGGSAQISDIVSFNSGVVAVGGFATHPQPTCSRAQGADANDLRTFQPAVIRWSPTESATAPPITLDRTDPHLTKLLPSDLGIKAGTSLDFGSYRTAYVNLCAENGSLGQHLAYRVSFPNGPGGAPGTPPNLPGQELTIVTPSAAVAHSVFLQARQWMFAGAAPKSERVSAHIGDETRAFSFVLSADFLPPGSPVKAHVVIWRRDRVLGEIYTTNLHFATALAEKQFNHMENQSAETGR